MADGVSAALRELGAMAPDEIAHFLAGQGIRGVRMIGSICPVARYLRRRCGVVITIMPTTWADLDRLASGERGADWIDGILPRRVQDFVQQFDDGRYPELEEIAAEAPECAPDVRERLEAENLARYLQSASLVQLAQVAGALAAECAARRIQTVADLCRAQARIEAAAEMAMPLPARRRARLPRDARHARSDRSAAAHGG